MSVPVMNKQQLQKMSADPGFCCRPGPERRQHPESLGGLRHQGRMERWRKACTRSVHQMRTRIITSPSFTGERILGAILFENTMDRGHRGTPDGRLSLGGEKGRTVPQGGQRSRAGKERSPVDEADAEAPGAARQGELEAHLWNENAVGHQAGRQGWHPGNCGTSSSRWQLRSTRRVWCPSLSRKWTSTAPTKPRRRHCLRTRCWRNSTGLPAGQLVFPEAHDTGPNRPVPRLR